MAYALLAFIAMPIIEIALLLRVGEAFGWLPTLLVVIITAVVGSAMLRQQGLATLNKARTRMDSGEMPAQQMLEGVLIMIGGVLLLTPGFVTDAFGFACLIPLTRQWMASRLSNRAFVSFSAGVGGGSRRAGSVGEQGFSPGGRPDYPPTGESTTRGSSTGAGTKKGDIIDGDFERIDDE